jgi:membrane protein implicated in regulation of membrane protease activity
MSLWFLVPSAICGVAAYLYPRLTDEPSYICAGLAVVMFPLALVLAPWEVQLLLLLGVLMVARSVLQARTATAPESELAGLTDHASEATEAHAALQSETEAIDNGDRVYRGLTWHVPDASQQGAQQVQHKVVELKYRGTTFKREI